MSNPTNKDRILHEIRTRLCSPNAQDREIQWHQLVKGVRAMGRDPVSAADALSEFLSITRAADAPGAPYLSMSDYHGLSEAEKLEVNSQYQACLKTAMRDFPGIFQAIG